jgi:hypothetical protein
MGLNVRIYDIISNGNYTVRYKSGNNPYPVETDSTFTSMGSYTPSTTEITISGLTFDTQYWIKMTDNTTGRYIVQNIYTHDSKAFPCYDTICFSIDVTCEEQETPTPTPTYTQTVTPTITPTRTPTLTPEICAAPTLNSITFVSGSTVSVSFVSGPNCVATEIGYSEDNVNWVNNTGSCTSPRLIELSGSTKTYHIRIKKICNGTSSSYVYDDFTFPTPTPTPTRTPTSTPMEFYYFIEAVSNCDTGAASGPTYIAKSFVSLSIGTFVNMSSLPNPNCTWKIISETVGPEDDIISGSCGTSLPVSCCC